MELLQKFEYGNFKVETFYNGTKYTPSKIYLKNKLIGEDSTFRPSPFLNTATEKMVCLLGFYTTRKTDVDEAFFEDFNCWELLKWSENSNEADDIRLMIYDFEERNNETFLSENEIDKTFCTRIEKYITTL